MKMDINIKSINREGSPTRGIVDITFNDSIKIYGFRIIQYKNRDGEFKMGLSMPQRKNKDGEYIDLCKPITKDFRKEIERNVFTAYNPDEKTTHGTYGANDEQAFVSAKVYPIKTSVDPNAKAMCSLTLGNSFVVDSLVIKTNEKTGNNFISVPSRASKDAEGKQEYKNIYELERKTVGIILKEYDKSLDNVIGDARSNSAKNQSSKGNTNTKTGPELPF